MNQTITWLGHGSWKMITPAGTNLYLDPWIRGNPACPVTLEEIGRVDIVCVTHGHSDHLGNAIEIVKKTNAVLVTLPEIAAYCELHGIPYDDRGGCVHLGGSVQVKDICIYAVFALHTSDIWETAGEKGTRLVAGSGTCGMIVKPEGGVTTYFAGDTGIFGDMALIGKLYHPEISILPVGGKYTMGVREAAYALEMLGSQILIPGHYNTFPGQMADIQELRRQVAVRAPSTAVVTLNPGETYTVDARSI